MRVIGEGQVLSPLRDSRDSGLPCKLRRDEIDEHISGPALDANGDESRHWRPVDGGLSETGGRWVIIQEHLSDVQSNPNLPMNMNPQATLDAFTPPSRPLCRPLMF